MRIPRAYRNLLIALVAGCALLIAFVVTARATDKPSFCRTCHEMDPYVDAWATGPHANTSCVECHVDHGTVPRLLHKFVALGEVWSHVKGTPPFPLDHTTPIPDARCTRCHERVVVKIARFDHAMHAKTGRCERCHRTAGHDVSVAALKAAGVYNSSYRSSEPSGVVVIGGGAANIPNHVKVGCSRCHDMAKTHCPVCHHPKHTAGGPKKTGACELCHAAGATWTFAHPKTETCAGCHTAPAKHRSGECSGCHKNAGTSWKFTHTTSLACASCHKAPANHRKGECSNCHKNAGRSWKFTHTKSLACSSCHKAPANHFGSTCSSCHSPSRSWRSATFNHPRIRGGEHSYRSFACSKCHPNGTGSSYCTCHKSANGPKDD